MRGDRKAEELSELMLWKEVSGSVELLGEGSGSRSGVLGGGCIGGDGALLRNCLDESLGGNTVGHRW